MIKNATLISIQSKRPGLGGQISYGSPTAIGAKCFLDESRKEFQESEQAGAIVVDAILYVPLDAMARPAEQSRANVKFNSDEVATAFFVAAVSRFEKSGRISHWQIGLRRDRGQ